ncbi:hypothetical protein M409DRAFT_69244 [Zasmidium cellare ATCC 36951]|uniref:FAD/NAD(P)-binding domain-containing protein n=1 Tax=Zasmidium cellare ATCC 36951 TaxID=1080233 RepID=A0A6A6C7Z6_ZASCE|nr:uncharacterized protein M409DRAFT_69244 [Zasmidium cellare ATCC 36951]KAF2162358.1 hypothetical protein M409DRAFT_69244 [Zasmidium cellare ATCC 36951]
MPPPTSPPTPLTPTTLFSALVLGAGPAGLSAALSLSRLAHPVAIFTTATFRNERAQHAHTILSRDHTPPAEIRRVAREQIEAYGTTVFIERGVVKARRVHGGFEVEDGEGGKWRGRKIVLAMGVRDVLPTRIEGYVENWGTNIYQCLFCDGIERSDRPAGLLGFPNAMAGHNVGMMVQMGCPNVTIFGDGELEVKDEATRKALEIAKLKGAVVDERRIEKLVNLGEENGVEIRFGDGSSERLGFLVHKPDVEIVSPEIARGLGVEIIDDGFGGQMLKRNEPFGETNVKGVLTAGDASILMRQVTAAMFQGGAAGAGVHFLISQDEERELEKKLQDSKA